MQTNFYPYLNIADMDIVRDVAGPGKRLVIWLQGCLKQCPGCINQTFLPLEVRQLLSLQEIIQLVKKYSDIHRDIAGITFSGGEPLLQARALSQLASSIKKYFAYPILCYTGNTLEELKTNAIPYAADLLKTVDILVDGAFVKEKRLSTLKWRGSSNQQIYYLNQYIDRVNSGANENEKNTFFECRLTATDSRFNGNTDNEIVKMITKKLKNQFGVDIMNPG